MTVYQELAARVKAPESKIVGRLFELPKTATMRVKKFQLRSRGNSSATWDREAAGIKVKKDV